MNLYGCVRVKLLLWVRWSTCARICLLLSVSVSTGLYFYLYLCLCLRLFAAAHLSLSVSIWLYHDPSNTPLSLDQHASVFICLPVCRYLSLSRSVSVCPVCPYSPLSIALSLSFSPLSIAVGAEGPLYLSLYRCASVN